MPALSAVANVFLGQAERIGPVQDRGGAGEISGALSNPRRGDQPECSRRQPFDRRSAETRNHARNRAASANPRARRADRLPCAPRARSPVRTIRSLRSHGETILLISHDLEEVLRLSDAITVLRDGRKVGTSAAREWSKRSLIHAMLGEDVALRGSIGEDPGRRCCGPRMYVFRGPRRYRPWFGRRDRRNRWAGRAGRTELLRALAGLDPGSTGSLRIDGRPVPWPRSPKCSAASRDRPGPRRPQVVKDSSLNADVR